MKTSTIVFVAVCGAIACGITYVNKMKPASATPGPVAAGTPSQTDTPAPTSASSTPKPTPPPVAATAPVEAAPTAATPAATESKPDDAAMAIHKAVDALLNAKSGKEKHELFQELTKSGQIDQVITELKQRMTDNPTDVGIPTTLGEAQLNKVRAMHDSGNAEVNEMGILAMQADQSFNAALKIDPQNWEANFVKASSMYYWPADPARDADVVQRLSGLIDQQETLASQPQFVQTYLVLGNEYQKLGQPDKALATYQLGLTKFPNDPALTKKINGQ